MLLAFAAITVPLMPVQQLFVWFWPEGARCLPHLYHRLLARVLGIKVVVSGPLPPPGAALIVANHVSWIDIIVLSAVMPVSFVAKSDIGRWPFFGTLAKLQRSVFVERERRHSTGRERETISQRLGAGGKVVLFPEGTSGDGRSVLPFRSSYFAAVHEARLPIVPVTLAYTRTWGLPMTPRELPRYAWYGDMDLPAHLWKALAEGPLTVEVYLHQALHLDHPKARKGLAAKAETLIRTSLVAALHDRRKTG